MNIMRDDEGDFDDMRTEIQSLRASEVRVVRGTKKII